MISQLQTLATQTQSTLKKHVDAMEQRLLQHHDTLRPWTIARWVRPFTLALLILAIVSANVSAAVIQVNMTPQKARQVVYQTLVDVKPALNGAVDDVLPGTIQILQDKGVVGPALANQYRKILIHGQAPANMPEIAYMLSLPAEERILYSIERLQEEGLLSNADVDFIVDLRNAPDEEKRGMAVAALENGSFGPLTSAILELAVDLSSIDPNADLETCNASFSDHSSARSPELMAQGWLGNALKWLGGLVEAVVDGALEGALYGFLFGGGKGAIIGGILGGIGAAGGYIASTTGGFMAGPNGEDCTGWPAPYPLF